MDWLVSVAEQAPAGSVVGFSFAAVLWAAGKLVAALRGSPSAVLARLTQLAESLERHMASEEGTSSQHVRLLDDVRADVRAVAAEVRHPETGLAALHEKHDRHLAWHQAEAEIARTGRGG